MKFRKNSEDPLDRAAEEIRNEAIDPGKVEAAADRVWNRLSAELDGESIEGETVAGCTGFRARIDDYLASRLSQPRVLLFEDHARECAACRRALAVAKAGERAGGKVVPFAAPHRRPAAMRWVLAAAAAVLVVAAGLAIRQAGFMPGTGAQLAEVRSVAGALYGVTSAASLPVGDGQKVPYGRPIRTAKNSRAVVKLADGSLIEMNERAELSLAERGGETTIHLDRGSIIVQAAKQRNGHMYVSTDDCMVSVVGTIFSVNRGSKGSRVSVIEGRVEVAQGGHEHVLQPGEQISTEPSLRTVPVAEEFAWSGDAGRYRQMIAELRAIGREIDRTIAKPGLRHDTGLLDSVPENTVVYAAIPNVGASLVEARRILKQRIAESQVLREWWQQHAAPAGADSQIDAALEKLRTFSEQLGDEVVVAVQAGEQGRFDGVLLTAELKDPATFKPLLQKMLDEAAAKATQGVPIRLIDDPASLPADPAASGDEPGAPVAGPGHHGHGQMLLWLNGSRLVATTGAAILKKEAAILAAPASNTFTGSAFHARLADCYREGASWLFGVDVQAALNQVVSRHAGDGTGNEIEALRRTGLLDARQLIVESHTAGERQTTSATLTFDGPRKGIASWLAAPAPMGALDYVTADATFVSAFVVKNPVSLLEDVITVASAKNSSFVEELARVEKEQGISLRDDLAAPLGGEVVIALDGPVLPVPSWKVVVEVYDPVRLQKTIEMFVGKVNQKFNDPTAQGLKLDREESGGRTYYVLSSPLATVQVNYVYENGYMIAAPSRALLTRAIEARAAGQLLTATERYRSLLPEDGEANFSAVVYESLGSYLGSIADQIGKSEGASPEDKAQMTILGAGSPAKLLLVYGYEDRLVFAGTSESSFLADLSMLLGMEPFTPHHHPAPIAAPHDAGAVQD